MMDEFNKPQETEENNERAKKTEALKKVKEPKRVRLSSVIMVSLFVFYLLSMAVLLLAGTGYVRVGTEEKDGFDSERFDEIYQLLKTHYVGELDEETMTLYALAAYAKATGDPYTQYLPKSTADSYIDGNYQSQSGIGVRVTFSDEPEGVFISYVFPESPAGKAGLKKGDIITAIEGQVVTKANYSDIIEKIPGVEGSMVALQVLRGTETKSFLVKRGSFTVESVEYLMLETAPDIGYIRIDGVATNTAKEFKNAITSLQAQGAKKFIFDVRDDGGGYLDVITEILDMLLPEGPIVRWISADGTEKANHSDADQIIKAPFAVLINGNTASAAELFAAALRDYKLATLVGETTYGKGVMQTLFPLKNGDTIKITTAYYYPPYGDNYNEKGVSPDIEASLPENEVYFTVTEEEDTQLQAAIAALNNTSAQD